MGKLYKSILMAITVITLLTVVGMGSGDMETVVKNQKIITENQLIIIENQNSILSNQKRIVEHNGERLDAIMTNQQIIDKKVQKLLNIYQSVADSF